MDIKSYIELLKASDYGAGFYNEKRSLSKEYSAFNLRRVKISCENCCGHI